MKVLGFGLLFSLRYFQLILKINQLLEVEKIRSRVIRFYIMDLDGYSLNQMMRIAGRGKSWWDASADDGQCSSVEKIQEILSKARNDQEDLWKTIVTSSTWSSSSQFGEPVASTSSGDHDQVRQLEAAACNGAQLVISRDQMNIPRRISRPPMTAETENSLDWSLCRMEEFNAAASGSQTSACPSTLPITLEEVPSEQPAMRLHHPGLQLGVHSMISKLELQPPLNPRLLQRIGPHFSRNPVSACNSLSNIPATTSTALAAAGDQAGLHELLSIVELAPDSEAHIQRHNLEGIPALGMERECCSPGIEGAGSAMIEVAIGSDSNNHQADLKKVVMTSPIIPRSFLSSLLHDGDHIIPEENKYVAQRRKRNRRTSVDTSNGQSSAMSARRTKRIDTKRDFTREAARDGGQIPTRVVRYQRLQKPAGGIHIQRAIPDDGHRSWKKYGSKSIQNSNFCRGYYKCVLKNCDAKKMVQATDKDPSLFEVIYMGTHTCSSGSDDTKDRLKKRQREDVDPPALVILVPPADHDAAPMSQLLQPSCSKGALDIVMDHQYSPTKPPTTTTSSSCGDDDQAAACPITADPENSTSVGMISHRKHEIHGMDQDIADGLAAATSVTSWMPKLDDAACRVDELCAASSITTADDLEFCHVQQQQLLHDAADQDFNFQDLMSDWLDLMDISCQINTLPVQLNGSDYDFHQY